MDNDRTEEASFERTEDRLARTERDPRRGGNEGIRTNTRNARRLRIGAHRASRRRWRW